VQNAAGEHDCYRENDEDPQSPAIKEKLDRTGLESAVSVNEANQWNDFVSSGSIPLTHCRLAVRVVSQSQQIRPFLSRM